MKEGKDVDAANRSVACGNKKETTRGKEGKTEKIVIKIISKSLVMAV